MFQIVCIESARPQRAFDGAPSGWRMAMVHMSGRAAESLVIWDNTGTMHRATPHDPNSGRMLHRFAVDELYFAAELVRQGLRGRQKCVLELRKTASFQSAADTDRD